MSDYAAAPIQIIAHAILTIDAAGNPQVTGRGFKNVTRMTPIGDFQLDFDEGTSVADIGSGGIVDEPGFGYSTGIVGPNGVDPRFARVSTLMRGGTTAPGTTTISANISVAFTSVPGQGATGFRLTTRNNADALVDPMGPGAPNANGSGLEIVVWYGNAGEPDDFTQPQFGPLFQPVMQFP